MTDFITSDIHFGHKNIMSFCPITRARYKNDVDFMNEEIIREWNQVVTPRDHTYILGDVAFCNVETAVKFMKRLNGSKTLIIGNHDKKLIKHREFQDCFIDWQDYYSINVNGTKVIMFHYPISEWDQMHRGSVHLHGHVHGGPNSLEGSRALDVGMDATGQVVTRLDVMVERALKGGIRAHHQGHVQQTKNVV
jgi:calcineurin-like phosphoesterase family protein